jgi:hypothetical protein
VPQLEPGHHPPAAPPPPPPRGQPRHQPQPPATFRLTTVGPQLRHTPAAAVGDLDPDHAAGGPDRDRDRLPSAPEPPCRMLLANSSLTSSAASSPHGCPGPSTPAVNARATRARSARPATVTLSRTAMAISAPAFPGPPRVPGNHPGPPAATQGCTPDSASRVKPGNTPLARPVRGRP